jgi:hypothetical protein
MLGLRLKNQIAGAHVCRERARARATEGEGEKEIIRNDTPERGAAPTGMVLLLIKPLRIKTFPAFNKHYA